MTRRAAHQPQKSLPEPPFFAGLSRDDIRRILDRAVIRHYAARSWLNREGETAGELYLLKSGLVRQSQVTPAGDDVLVRFIVPGEVLGYFALAPGGSNQASSLAVVDSEVVVWEKSDALELLHSTPQAALNLFHIAVRDAVYYHSRTRRLLTQSVSQRVMWALSELVSTIGVRTANGIEIGRGAGQRELAELAGTTIFTVSRELGKLESQGLLEKHRGRIVIYDPDKLEAP